jgi:hypothetical protein
MHDMDGAEGNHIMNLNNSYTPRKTPAPTPYTRGGRERLTIGRELPSCGFCELGVEEVHKAERKLRNASRRKQKKGKWTDESTYETRRPHRLPIHKRIHESEITSASVPLRARACEETCWPLRRP